MTLLPQLFRKRMSRTQVAIVRMLETSLNALEALTNKRSFRDKGNRHPGTLKTA